MADVPSSAFNIILARTNKNRFTISRDLNTYSKLFTCLAAKESGTKLVLLVVFKVKNYHSSCVIVAIRVSRNEVVSIERYRQGFAGHPTCDEVGKVGRLDPVSLEPIEYSEHSDSSNRKPVFVQRA